MPFFKSRKVSKDEAKKRVERCLVVVSVLLQITYLIFYFLNSCFDLMFDRSVTNFLFGYVLKLIS